MYLFKNNFKNLSNKSICVMDSYEINKPELFAIKDFTKKQSLFLIKMKKF